MTPVEDAISEFDTMCVRGAGAPNKQHRPISEPVVRATTFAVTCAADHRELYRTRASGFYQRFAHPNAEAAAQRCAELEHAERAIVCGSGMGAIATTFLALLTRDSHVVVHREIFAQTRSQLHRLESAFGVSVTEVDARDPQAVRRAMRPETRLIYAETPTNPLLEILDIAALGAIARDAGCELVVDSTFASPAVQTPLDLGATAVLHSGTKYLGGHSDVMCGVVAGRASLMALLHDTQIDYGTVLDPAACWLLGRGLQTLALRVARQSETAHGLAAFLEGHELVAEVRYPWLASHESVAIATRQMRSGGGMVSFQPKGGVEVARRMVDALRLIPIATSLGGVETVIELPYDLDFEQAAVDGQRIGRPALVRLSVGLEDPGDLRADLDQALRAAAR